MVVSIGSNISSLKTLRRLEESDSDLSKSLVRLGSGMRINSASDDAASLAIAESLKTNARILNQGVRNSNDGISLLNIADSAIGNLTGIIQRKIELAEQSANGTLTDEQRSGLDAEDQALTDEYNRIIATTEFNGLNLLEDNTSTVFQLGGNAVNLDVLGTELLSAGSLVGTGSYTTLDTSTLYAEDFTAAGYVLSDTNGDGVLDIYAVQATATNGGNGLTLDVVSYTSDGAGGYTETELANTVVDTAIQGILGIDSIELDLQGNSLAVRTNFTRSVVGDVTDDTEIDLNPTTKVAQTIDIVPENTVVTDEAITGTSTLNINNDGVDDRVTLSGGTITVQTQDTTSLTQDTIIARALPTLSTSVDTRNNALLALDQLSTVLEDIGEIRGVIGASLSRISVARSLLEASSTESSAAESRIRAADIAEESAGLVAATIRRQAGALILAQANQQPALALDLLRV